MMLKKLVSWLKRNGHLKAAQQVESLSDNEWAEPWHEEVVQEYGEVIPEEAPPMDDDLSVPHGMEEDIYENSQHFEDILLVLKHEGLTPISTGGSSAVLGSGSYGVALRTVYNGMPAVVKAVVDPAHDDSDDIGTWKKILSASQSMPAELKKHIPSIYYMNKDTLKRDDPWYNDIQYEIIVMEELYPLNKSMDRLFHGYTKSNLKLLFKDEEYVYKVSQTIANTIARLASKEGMIRPPDIKAVDIFSLLNGEEIDSKTMTSFIMHYLRSNHTNLLDYVPDEDLEKYIVKDLRSNFSTPETPLDWFTHLTKKNGDFKEGPFFTHFWESIPETGMFFKTLITLAKAFNIGWTDLATRNIMMDKDGNLKIIDVGLYENIKA